MKSKNMKIVIIDYGAGNIQSVKFAVERLGCQAELSDNPLEILSADKIIFPGVGKADYAMEKIKNAGLDKIIPDLKQPVLGICLGMQLMCDYTEEGNVTGLGIFPLAVKRFDNSMKVPHIGWNTINEIKSELFNGIKNHEYMYFVHSYYIPVNSWTIAETSYGITYSSSLKKNNFYGCQFHPEKSADAGSKLLENFLNSR